MLIQQEIRLVAESMELGGTLRQVCPSCSGGTKSERSMTITRFPNNIVKYNCFRESCINHARGSFLLTKDGALRVSSQESDHVLKHVRPKRKIFNGDTYLLTAAEEEYIWDKWGIRKPPYWWHTPQYGGRVAMSVRSFNYAHRGWCLRDIGGKAQSKTLMYVEEGETPLSWYRDRKMRGTILVEDIPSAVRASKHMNAVALLGTGCGLDRATEIQENASLPILIALDQDATDTAFEILKRWGLLWGEHVKVLPLKQDIKDLQEKDLEGLLVRALL